MFGIGPWELAIVLFIVLLLFGKRIPEMARSLGKSVTEFKKGSHEGIDDHSDDQENSTRK